MGIGNFVNDCGNYYVVILIFIIINNLKFLDVI